MIRYSVLRRAVLNHIEPTTVRLSECHDLAVILISFVKTNADCVYFAKPSPIETAKSSTNNLEPII